MVNTPFRGAVIWPPCRRVRIFFFHLIIRQCRRPARYLRHFLRNARLTRAVVTYLQRRQHVFRAFGSLVHRLHAGTLFAGVGFHHRPVNYALNILRLSAVPPMAVGKKVSSVISSIDYA